MGKSGKAKNKTGKKSGAKKAVKKKPGASKPASKSKKAKKTILKKSTVKKKLKISGVKAFKKKPVKKAKAAKKSLKKVVKKVLVKKVKPDVKKPTVQKVKTNNTKPSKIPTPVQLKKLKSEKIKPLIDSSKSKIDQEEKLHSKTQRIMKELEETMDLEKVKPRIKVPSYMPPKPKPAPVLKLVEPVNTKKEKYQLEFEFRSSKSILFSYLCDSSGMAGWFADEVRSSDNNYTFVWEGSETHAKLVALKDQLLVRYEWTDENDGTYFQFEIKEDDITSDIALMITDWANPGEKESNARLWESQVQNLRQLIGSV